MVGFLIFLVVVILLWWWMLGRDVVIKERLRIDGKTSTAQVIFSLRLNNSRTDQWFGTVVGYKFETMAQKKVFGLILLWSDDSAFLKKGDVLDVEYSDSFPFRHNTVRGKAS